MLPVMARIHHTSHLCNQLFSNAIHLIMTTLINESRELPSDYITHNKSSTNSPKCSFHYTFMAIVLKSGTNTSYFSYHSTLLMGLSSSTLTITTLPFNIFESFWEQLDFFSRSISCLVPQPQQSVSHGKLVFQPCGCQYYSQTQHNLPFLSR